MPLQYLRFALAGGRSREVGLQLVNARQFCGDLPLPLGLQLLLLLDLGLGAAPLCAGLQEVVAGAFGDYR